MVPNIQFSSSSTSDHATPRPPPNLGRWRYTDGEIVEGDMNLITSSSSSFSPQWG